MSLILNSWWKALDEEKRKIEEEVAIKKKKEDWWTDSSYKGKVFLPLSTAYDKIVTKEGEKDAKPSLHQTFSVPTQHASEPFYNAHFHEPLLSYQAGYPASYASPSYYPNPTTFYQRNSTDSLWK